MQNKDTALMIAARNGYGSVVSALLKVEGIDVNVQNVVRMHLWTLYDIISILIIKTLLLAP